MAVNDYTYGATIEVISTGKKYHTYSDLGLVMTDSDPIGDPEQETNYLTVPGLQGLLDISETLTGHPVFRGRTITMQMVAIREPEQWGLAVSRIRNKLEGRRVKIVFDDNVGYYWIGRINLRNPERAKRLGKFVLSGYVNAYQYEIASSQEEIAWDDVDFETTYFGYLGLISISGTYDLVIPKGDMATVPTIGVWNQLANTANVTVRYSRNGATYTLVGGPNRIPQIKVAGDNDVTLRFTGYADIEVDYRRGSL